MFWTLLLAHFIADYPLQPGWMVAGKRRPSILLLHVLIHLVVMFLLIGSARLRLLPFLLVITVVHFGVDTFKNWIWAVRPAWIIGPYVLDQILHIVTLLAVTAWATAVVPELVPPTYLWQIVATGYLLATYVWFISERVAYYSDPDYQAEVIAHNWSRMFARAAVLTLFLVLGRPLLPPGGLAFAAIVTPLPYLSGQHRMRALLTDIVVPAIVAVFVLLALRYGSTVF